MNECETLPSACINGQCINNQGSYRCECHLGFTLARDGRTCRGRCYYYARIFRVLRLQRNSHRTLVAGFEVKLKLQDFDGAIFIELGLLTYSPCTPHNCSVATPEADADETQPSARPCDYSFSIFDTVHISRRMPIISHL